MYLSDIISVIFFFFFNLIIGVYPYGKEMTMYTIAFQGKEYTYKAKNAFHALNRFMGSIHFRQASLSEQFSYKVSRAS